MTIDVERVADDWDDWDRAIGNSPHAGPFHQACGLGLLSTHAAVDVHPLIGYKGQQPVGVLPVFETRRGPFTEVTSPPADQEVYYLGPALAQVDQLKQRKYERRNKAFIHSCLDWIDDTLAPDICHIRTVDQYRDHRPFKECGFEITPYYTYVVDLEADRDDLLMRLSSDARSNITGTDEDAYTIEIGGLEEAQEIIRRVTDRHEAQGEAYHITPAFVEDLYTTFPEGQVNPYVCRTEDGIAGGILSIAYGDTTYRWQGGTKGETDLPVNDLLDWRIMCDAMDGGYTRYDFVGANTRRINRYKSKFAPELRTYHGARRLSRRARFLSTVKQSVPVQG